MNTSPRAFISYARNDEETASRLQRELAALDIRLFSDSDIPSETDWGAHLRKTMDQADAVIFVVSAASVASAYVMSEIGAAIAAGKPNIPVMTTGGRLPAGLPAPLRKWQFVRAGNRDANAIAVEIRERLESLSAA